METEKPQPNTKPTYFHTPEGKKTLEQMEEEYQSLNWQTKLMIDFKGWCHIRQFDWAKLNKV